jgi:hypothetical protein
MKYMHLAKERGKGGSNELIIEKETKEEINRRKEEKKIK